LISARSTWASYQLDGATGAIRWRLGGPRSTFTMADGTSTAWQHDARLQRDGTVTSFDDGSTPPVHYQSRGLRVAIASRRRSVRMVRAYAHPGSRLLSGSQGNAQALGDESMVVGWGAVPSVSEIARNGALVFDAHLPPGTSSYRAFRFSWSGHPLSPPVASAGVLAPGDSTAVFASWNGATEVASWRVLAGATTSSLTAQARMPDSGFESSITFPNA